jgi:hypothetical protein
VILWNSAHPKYSVLTPDFIASQTGKFLHRFSWLEDSDIGELTPEWNWLAIEYPENKNAKLILYTLGTRRALRITGILKCQTYAMRLKEESWMVLIN